MTNITASGKTIPNITVNPLNQIGTGYVSRKDI